MRLNGITVGKVANVGSFRIERTQPHRARHAGSREPITCRRFRWTPRPPSPPRICWAPSTSISRRAGQGTTVQAGAEIKSLDTREFDDVVQQGYSTLASLNGIFKKLDGILDQLQAGNGTIGKLLSDDELYKKVVGIVDETQSVIAALDLAGRHARQDSCMTTASTRDLRGTLARVNMLADSLQKGEGTHRQADEGPGSLRRHPCHHRTTARDTGRHPRNGKGTVGKLLKSDDLHNQLQATMGRLDTLLDKINNGQGTIGQLLVNPSLYQNPRQHHARDQRPDEGFPRQSEEVPAHQARPVLTCASWWLTPTTSASRAT